MNKTNLIIIVLLVFVSVISFPEETLQIRDTFLQNYFNESSFEILNQLIINNDDAFLAVTYANKARRIIDRAIIFSFNGSLFRIYLYIEKDKIQNSNGEILFKTDLNAFGWELGVYPETLNLWFDFYSDGGRSVADGFGLEWIQDDKKFTDVKIDTSQY